MLKGDDSLVSSGSDINVHALKLVFNSNNFETLHAGLECADGVDFCDINSSSASPHGLGAALSNITKATNKNFFAWNHDVSSPVDSIDKRMFAPIDIIELRFGDWIVDINAGT